MQNRRYPKLFIRSKNELAKHLSNKYFSKEESLNLINGVISNFDQYWKDNKKHSKPDKNKYVRNAKSTNLGKLLDKINKSILAPHDKMLPHFIFGGIGGLNHKKAAEHLLGEKRKRTILKLDIKTFFENVTKEKVYHFFKSECGCDYRASKILSDVCCVPIGPKGNGSSKKTIARGFATSSRLAVWCNLDVFIRIDRLVKKRLKGKDSRLAIYVDDIGITVSRVSKEDMKVISEEIEELLLSNDLPLNQEKKFICSHEEGIEHLGLIMYRNKVSVGKKTRSKIDKIKNQLKKGLSPIEIRGAKKKRIALMKYKKYVEKS